MPPPWPGPSSSVDVSPASRSRPDRCRQARQLSSHCGQGPNSRETRRPRSRPTTRVLLGRQPCPRSGVPKGASDAALTRSDQLISRQPTKGRDCAVTPIREGTPTSTPTDASRFKSARPGLRRRHSVGLLAATGLQVPDNGRRGEVGSRDQCMLWHGVSGLNGKPVPDRLNQCRCRRRRCCGC